MDTKPAPKHPRQTSSSPHSEHQCKERPIINYFQKSMDLILKSTKLIFVILHRFSISPLQGISLLAETICLVQRDLWSWSLCSSWSWELRFQGMGPHWWVPNWNSHQGTWCPWGKSSCLQQLWDWEFSDRAHLPPSGFTLAVPGLLTELWEQFCSLQNIYWGKCTPWGRKSSTWYIQK